MESLVLVACWSRIKRLNHSDGKRYFLQFHIIVTLSLVTVCLGLCICSLSSSSQYERTFLKMFEINLNNRLLLYMLSQGWANMLSLAQRNIWCHRASYMHVSSLFRIFMCLYIWLYISCYFSLVQEQKKPTNTKSSLKLQKCTVCQLSWLNRVTPFYLKRIAL